MLRKYELQLVDAFPDKNDMTEGVVYFSQKRQRSAHLCPCSCGELVLLSHFRGGWRYYISTDGEITISTQVRNKDCNTNYIIREGYAFRGTWL